MDAEIWGCWNLYWGGGGLWQGTTIIHFRAVPGLREDVPSSRPTLWASPELLSNMARSRVWFAGATSGCVQEVSVRPGGPWNGPQASLCLRIPPSQCNQNGFWRSICRFLHPSMLSMQIPKDPCTLNLEHLGFSVSQAVPKHFSV